MKMRASRVVKKHQIICDQVDVLPPKQDELLVRTAWAALCGSDVHGRHHPRLAPVVFSVFQPPFNECERAVRDG